MLEDGLSYPMRGDNWLGRIFVGGLLGLLSFLLIPVFLLFGYLVWVLESSARDEAEPPAFENWGEMLGDGLKATVVAVAYGIVPVLVMVVSIGFGSLGAATGSEAAAGVVGGIGALGFLVSFVAMFVMYYLIPAALTNMALEDRVGAAFEFGDLREVLLSVDYLVAWLVPFLIGFVMNVVTLILVAVTLGVGLILVPFIQFYVQVTIFYLFGRAFGHVTGLGEEPPVTDAPEAAD